MNDGARSCGPRLHIARAVALSMCLLAGPAYSEPARLHHYSVAVDQGLVTLHVRACFSGTPPRRLVAASIDAENALEKAELEGAKRAFTTNGTEMRLGSLPEGACVVYAVDLSRFIENPSKARSAQRVGGDLVTDLGTWFWRPDALEVDEDIDVDFELPAGISVSTPWQIVVAPDGRVVHRVGHGPYDWPAAIAFGHFSERTLELSHVRLRIAVLGEFSLDEARITDWLHRAAVAVTTLYGRFPVAAVQILVVPGARGNEPVPWAYVLRGGGLSAHFFVNQHRAGELDADWTAVHELSHLLLPYVLSNDAWLSEGAASYFEHVLRARAGTIDAQEAWQRIHDGFKRGMQSARGQSLADATERMYRSGAFLRVYWEGAAIMLLADQRLRSRTKGGQSLDSALDALQRCCLSPELGWTGRELFRKLDELSGTTVFAELYEEYVRSPALPDVAEVDRLLGLEMRADGKVVLLDEGPQRAARDAIMRATEGGSTPPDESAGAAQITPRHH